MSISEDLILDGKNKFTVYCTVCPSKILSQGMGNFTDISFDLPLMRHKAELPSNSEEVKGYWQVADMYSFENMGFSNTVDNLKYLTCADCEIGPIGWHDLSTKQSYVALTRVKHK